MFLKLLFFLFIYKISALDVKVSNLDQEKVFFDLKNAKQLFDEFIKTFVKHYNNDEYERRLQIFTKNLEDVNNRNKNTSSELYGITQFLDMTDEEFTRDYTGLKWVRDLEDQYKEADDLQPMMNFYGEQLPDKWDWRDQGVVTPVKHQGYCGSCWAFSAVGCVESQYAIKHKELLSLSEQQLVDCFDEGGGCFTGSLPHLALNAAAQMGGFMTQSEYPYKAAQGRCRFNKRRVVVRVNHGQMLSMHDEEQLKKLVYKYGPVSIGIAALAGFQQYRGGISTPEGLGCSRGVDINHAVLLVGYGTENGDPYWIIKNSYGQDWGEQGFMRLIRGRNACSILHYIATADVA